jgi:site-specific recombinase XerD
MSRAPPETLNDTDYANLLRVPDRRTLAGKRDYALLRVLGDCGLRSAEP